MPGDQARGFGFAMRHYHGGKGIVALVQLRPAIIILGKFDDREPDTDFAIPQGEMIVIGTPLEIIVT